MMHDDTLYTNGIKFMKKRDWDNAHRVFIKLVNKFPSKFLYNYYLCLCYLNMGRLEEASRILGKFDDIFSPQVYILRGYHGAKSGNFAKAVEYFSKVLELDADNITALLGLAYTYSEIKDFEKTEECYLRVLDIENMNVPALHGLGYALAEQDKDLDEALKYCRLSLLQDPKNSAALDSLGWVYYKMGFYNLAMKEIKKAIRLSPNDKKINEHYELIMKEI